MENNELDNNDTEFEEEEFYVYVDFDAKVPNITWDDPDLNIKITCLDTPEPLIQINSKVFKGSYEYSCGTNVFFEEDPSPNISNSNFNIPPSTYYKYAGKTEKILKPNRIFVKKREENTSQQVIKEDTLSMRLQKNYHQVLNQFLKPQTNPPREPDAQDEKFFEIHCKDQ